MIYRVNWLWSSSLIAQGVCTQHVFDAEPWDPVGGNVGLVATTVDAQLTTLFRAMLHTTHTLHEINVSTVRDPNDLSQVPVSSIIGLSLAGTRATADSNLPGRIGGLINWRTGYTPRYARGRMFTPPVENAGDVVSNLLSVGGSMSLSMTAFGNRVLDGNRIGPGADYGGAWDSEELAFVVYSRTRHKLGAAPNVFTINSWSNTRRLAYLSSRDR